MAIYFAPKRAAILICHFDMARVDPEMRKTRQVVVVSATALNHRHAKAAGTCVVVPFTTVPPDAGGDDDVFVAGGTYWSLPDDSWARCKLIDTVSHDRLDLMLRHGKRHSSEFLSDVDMDRISVGIRSALAMP